MYSAISFDYETFVVWNIPLKNSGLGIKHIDRVIHWRTHPFKMWPTLRVFSCTLKNTCVSLAENMGRRLATAWERAYRTETHIRTLYSVASALAFCPVTLLQLLCLIHREVCAYIQYKYCCSDIPESLNIIFAGFY